MSEPPSSPPRAGTSVEDALAWYKAQYEVLEGELSEFQASSKELEAELEKDAPGGREGEILSPTAKRRAVDMLKDTLDKSEPVGVQGR